MKSIFFVLTILSVNSMLLAQNPVCTFNYQGAVRDAADNVLANRNIGLRLSILATPGGTALYTEEHTTLTSGLGLFDVEAGGGTKTGGTMDWMDIQWGENSFYLKTEVDINGGTNYEFLGESPVRSVPLANLSKSSLHALTSSNLIKDAVVNISELNAQIIEGDLIASTNFGYYDEFNVFIPVLVIIGGKKNFWIDKIFAEDICAEGVALTDGFGDPIPVLDVINKNQVVVNATNVYTANITTGTMSVLDAGGNPQDAFYIDEFGKNALSIEKLYADDICAYDLTIFDENGDPFFDVNPGANQITEYGFVFNHNIMVNGGIMAEFKQFVIDHPLDPVNKNLRHFSVESDQMVNIYSGTIQLDKRGEAWIELPDWFEALNTNFSYQLTCIGGYSNVYIDKEIKDNKFKIAGGRKHLKVSWQVNGVRHDKQAQELNLPVEEFKSR